MSSINEDVTKNNIAEEAPQVTIYFILFPLYLKSDLLF